MVTKPYLKKAILTIPPILTMVFIFACSSGRGRVGGTALSSKVADSVKETDPASAYSPKISDSLDSKARAARWSPPAEITSPKANPLDDLPESGDPSSTIYVQISGAKPTHKPEVFFGYLRLLSTAVFNYNPLKNRAVIEDLLTSRKGVYTLGAVIPYGAKLVRIHGSGIVLEKDGLRRELAVAGELGNPEGAAVLNSKGYQQVSEREWLVQPNHLIQATGDIYTLLTQTSFQNYGDGAGGFLMHGVRPGSLVQELGLEQGDVVSTINGQAINSLTELKDVYQRIRKESVIQLGLKRREQELGLSYYVVPDGPPKYKLEDVLESPDMLELFPGN